MLLPMAFPGKFCLKWVIKLDTSAWYIFQNVTREREASKTVILITQHPSSIRFYRSLGRKCLIERFSYYAIPISWIKLRHVQIQFLENFKILRSLETHGNQSTGLLHISIYWFPFTGIYLYWERNTQQKNRILFESQQSDHYNWLSTCCNCLFLYLLKISENQRFSEVFRGCRMRSLALIGFNRLIANVITAILFICIDSGGHFR